MAHGRKGTKPDGVGDGDAARGPLHLGREPKILADAFARDLTGFASDQELLDELHRIRTGDGRIDPTKMRAFFALRSRYAEDELEAATERGIPNYVILGAGLDSFAFRRPEMMRKLDVYEVDHPASQTWKCERLAELSLELPPTLHFVPVDFERQTLAEGLSAGGLARGTVAFFSWLGVTQYLTAEAVLKTFGEIASFAGSGSELVVQFVLPPATLYGADHALVEALAARSAEVGEPWLSFFEPGVLEGHLKERRFRLISHFGPEEAFERCLRGRADGLSLPGYFSFIKAEVA